MAELCQKCFIETWHPDQYDIDRIVMSEDNAVCEGCMSYGPYVDHIRGEFNDKDSILDFFDELVKEKTNEQTNLDSARGNPWFG